MSLHRASTSLAYSLIRASRVQSLQSSQPLCPRCFRKFPVEPISRRFASATAPRLQSLETQNPPPRNTDIPDTSIASSNASIDRQTPDVWSGKPPQQPQGAVSVPEGEAQQPRPVQGQAVGSIATEATQTMSSAKKKPKLRPRKAALTLTPAAVEQLRGLLAQPDPKLIRVGVKNRGCSGLAYHLEYVEKPGTFDEAVEQDGVKVLVDSKALFSIIGSEMDWAEDKLSRRFVFRNPNITEQCGCGESFSIG